MDASKATYQGRGRPRHATGAAGRLGMVLVPVATVSVLLTVCGGQALAASGPPAPGNMALSVTAGPPGTPVTVTGNAGPGCTVGKNWHGFQFVPERAPGGGAAVEMTTPVATGGAWAASFVVPSFLGSARGHGAVATAGTYQFVAPDCLGAKVARAAFQVERPPSSFPAARYVAMAATPDGAGYWVVQAGGQVTAFGDARVYGFPRGGEGRLRSPVVSLVRTVDGRGYWVLDAAGRVFNFGDAANYGSLTATQGRQAPVVGMAEAPNGKGYWLLSANGSVHGFGAARVEGHPSSRFAPYDAIGTRNAGGYMVTSASNGATYLYPGGLLAGGGASTALSATLVGTAPTPSGNGAWEAGTDGGVITIGDAKYFGALVGLGLKLNGPVTAVAALPNGLGYWLLESDGTMVAFGSATFYNKV